MKNESDACTLFKNSVIKAGGWCCKIPDPSSDFRSTIQRPFDLFGVFRGLPLHVEMKHMKGGLFSFDLQTIEDHQIANLKGIKEMIPTSLCWVVLAVNVRRGDKRFYIFEDIFEVDRRRKAHENFKQKELLGLPYFEAHLDKDLGSDLINLTDYPLNRRENTDDLPVQVPKLPARHREPSKHPRGNRAGGSLREVRSDREENL